MSEKALIHCVWAAAVMYVVAVVCLAVTAAHRQGQPAEVLLPALVALFGPIAGLVAAAVTMWGRRP